MITAKSKLTPTLELGVDTSLNEQTGKWENRLCFNGKHEEGSEVTVFGSKVEAMEDAQNFVTETTKAMMQIN